MRPFAFVFAFFALAIAMMASKPLLAADMCSDTDAYIGRMIVAKAKINRNAKYLINGITGCARFICISATDRKCGGSAVDLFSRYNDRRLVHSSFSPPIGAIIFYGDTKGTCSQKLSSSIRRYGHVAISLGNGRALSVIKQDGAVSEHSVDRLYDGISPGATGCMIQGWVGPRDFVMNFPN